MPCAGEHARTLLSLGGSSAIWRSPAVEYDTLFHSATSHLSSSPRVHKSRNGKSSTCGARCVTRRKSDKPSGLWNAGKRPATLEEVGGS